MQNKSHVNNIQYDLKNNYYYRGQTSNSKAHGQGTISIPNIGFLEGEFFNNTLNSKWSLSIDGKSLKVEVGTLFPRWADSISISNNQPTPESSAKFFSAEIKCDNGGKTGKAVIKFQNYHSYIGALKDLKFEGSGKYFWGKEQFYEGQWKDGVFHGYGKIVNQQSLLYEGDFVMGKFHGTGKCLLTDGWVYDGEWENGHFYGVGVLSSPDKQVFILLHDREGNLVSLQKVGFTACRNQN